MVCVALGKIFSHQNNIIILKWIFKEWDGETWARLIWLRIGTGDGLVNAIMNLRIP